VLDATIAAAALALSGPQIGVPAPDFHLTTVTGAPVALADYRGKTLVVNVWATWCPPCREETPDVLAVAKREAAGGNVVFLGVDTTETAPVVRAFVADKGVPYAEAIGDDAFSRAFDVNGYPTTFVISPDGVLRARFVGNISQPALTAFIAAARTNRNGVLVTDAQKQVDALLAPSNYPLTGTPADVRASVKKILGAIDAAENVDGDVDYLALQAKATALLDAAANALQPVVAGTADRAQLALLRGRAAANREDWPAAIATFRVGLQLAPNDPALLNGVADAYAATHEHAQAADAYAAAAGDSPSAVDEVGIAQEDELAGRSADAGVAFARAIALARAAVSEKPADAHAIRVLAWCYLKEGQVFADADPVRARPAFAHAAEWAAKLPPTDARYAMYSEEAQEGAAALDAHPGGATAISLAPWTGPDLPGSIESTAKYRLVVSGTPGKIVALDTSGLPTHWVASFCSDGSCAPFRREVTLPASGVAVLEFQVIPESKVAVPPTVVVAGDGAQASVRVPR
jgi:thiol-disulfide isomerase/thioredoxin